MKRQSYNILLTMLIMLGAMRAQAQTTWDFTTLSSSDDALITADNSGNWKKDTGSSNNRWCYIAKLEAQPLMANGSELDWGKGLLFSCGQADAGNLRIDIKSNRGWIGGSGVITIPNLKRGQTVSIDYMSSGKDVARAFTPTNLNGTSGFDPSAARQTGTGTVAADGDVVLTPTGALYIYSLTVSAVPETGSVIVPGAAAELYEDVVNNATTRDNKVSQMYVETTDGGIKYYNTADLTSVDMDDASSIVTITTKSGTDTYYGSVRNISFAKGASQGDDGDIHNNGVVITEAKGWLESAYVKWNLYSGADTYNVYVKGGQFADWTKIDNMLVRNYGTYGRADMVGLRAATNYAFKVVPVTNGNETASAASTAENLNVKNYSREGFAHKTWTKGIGAYNNDGTLKSNAKVFYVTKNTAKTITCDVVTDNKGGVTKCTGLQAIIDAYQKGHDTTPLAFRIIGLVELANLDGTSSSEEGLQVKGNKADSELNITFEGIGDDATLRGFGFLVRNAKSVEFRNFAILRCMDDGISLDTDNSNIWIHHIDMFYGKHGSGDHEKGDGSIDVKADSKYVTVSYCHYWDTGKSNMFGMKSESGPNYISYDHNWFDHSDSRHPRVRTMSVHVWNNFFDNNGKYGVGATTGSSVFVENNYFLNTKKPILSSNQGTDALGSGTFSGENGGMIKAYGNYIDRSAKNFRYYTQSNPASTGYDAYETSTRDEQVPSSEKTVAGGTTYNNFDTNSSLMYTYNVIPAAEVPNLVTGWYGAGRLNHGDISYTFTDNVGNDDTDSAVDAALEAIIDGYSTKLTGIFGGETISDGGQGGQGGQGGEGGEGGQGGEGGEGGEGGSTISASVTCNFESGAPSNSLFTVTNGNYSNSKGTATVNGVTYTTCLKIESQTSIAFTTDKEMTLTLVFGSQDSKYTMYINTTEAGSTETVSKKVTGTADNGTSGQGTLTYTLPAGSHELKKADTGNLFFIALSE